MPCTFATFCAEVVPILDRIWRCPLPDARKSGLVEEYHRSLGGFDADALKAAIDRVKLNHRSTTWATIAELHQAASGISGSRGGPEAPGIACAETRQVVAAIAETGGDAGIRAGCMLAGARVERRGGEVVLALAHNLQDYVVGQWGAVIGRVLGDGGLRVLVAGNRGRAKVAWAPKAEPVRVVAAPAVGGRLPYADDADLLGAW